MALATPAGVETITLAATAGLGALFAASEAFAQPPALATRAGER